MFQLKYILIATPTAVTKKFTYHLFCFRNQSDDGYVF
jgi:hypothetical protein